MNDDDVLQFIKCGALIGMPEKKVLVGWGERVWKKCSSEFCGPHFYFPDFFLELEKPWFNHSCFAIVDIDHLIKILSNFVCCDLNMPNWIPAEFKMFQSAFEDLQVCFEYQSLSKAVPFVFEQSTDPINLVKSLCSALDYVKKNQTYVYGFWSSTEGILGATPELLFHQENGVIHTVACAGTCSNNEEGILTEEKNSVEHAIVIKGIQDALHPFGDVVIGKQSILRLPLLSHILTQIDFHPKKSISYEQLVNILHPTPALGAFPKEPGIRWLRDFYKDVDRKRFGAPVGYYLGQNNNFLCLVGIRNVQWSQNNLRIGVGCGVVQQSIMWKEWEELKLKLAATKEMLGL